MHQKPIFSILCEKHCFFTDNSLVLMSPILHKMHVLNFMGKCTTRHKCINRSTSLLIILKSNSTTFWLQSATTKGNKDRYSGMLRTLHTVSPMPGGCLVTMGPQTSQLIAACTTFLCHWENVTVGLISLFVGFVLIYSVFCV